MIKFAETLSTIGAVIASLLIAVAIVLVCQMVFVRYVLVQSTAWQTEVVTFSLVAATLLGSAYVLKERGHVAVELAVAYASPPVKRIMQIMADGVVLLFSLIMLWKSGHLTWEAFVGDWTTDSIYEFPMWIPYSAIPIGFALLVLQAIACMLKTYQADEAELKEIKRSH